MIFLTERSFLTGRNPLYVFEMQIRLERLYALAWRF